MSVKQNDMGAAARRFAANTQFAEGITVTRHRNTTSRSEGTINFIDFFLPTLTPARYAISLDFDSICVQP